MPFLVPVMVFLKTTLVPWLFSLPKWVWYTVVGVVAFLYVLHWYGGKVRQEQELLVAKATQKEVARQTKVAETEIERAKRLAAENERKLNQTKEALDNANVELAKFKAADGVCLPAAYTDKLRRQSIRRR